MPELPEVETIARGVDKRVGGDRILDTWFSSYKEPFKTSPRKQALGLAGRVILNVHRTGKHIVCELGPAEADRSGPAQRAGASAADAPQAQWIVHLGMTGRLLVSAAGAPMAAHTHARLSLASGLELHFVDPRRFGRLEFRDLGRVKGFGGAGAEPLTIPETDFAVLFKARKLSIKAALLNQQILTGVGNIYADESLFRAGIRPLRRSEKLSRAELERLRLALREVLEHAIRLGGSSVSDYVDAEGERGFFQLEHNVYRRTGEPCRVCETPVRRILVTRARNPFLPAMPEVAGDLYKFQYSRLEIFPKMQNRRAESILQLIENNNSRERYPDCYVISASDVPAAGVRSGQPNERRLPARANRQTSGPNQGTTGREKLQERQRK